MNMQTAPMWNDKRYHSLDYELKNRYGEKLYKLSLNGGMSCPNRDGTLDDRGCIFCSRGGSGDFAAASVLSVSEQIEAAKKLLVNKHTGTRYIAYFQAYTNTYAPIEKLRALFTEAITHKDIAVLSIATRPDCLSDEVLALLAELNAIKPVWVELGLQTIHPSTAAFIRRGYPLSCFEGAVKQLRSLHIEVITHVILGLPYETREQMLQTIDYLAYQDIQGIKLQLLHVLKNTDLEPLYLAGTFDVLSEDSYIDLVISCIERLPAHMVIHRITGDGPKSILIAPTWSGNKRQVLNHIQQQFKLRNTWQGKYYTEREKHGRITDSL